MANKFVKFLTAVGKDFEKGLAWAVKYAPSVEKLVALIFPAVAPEVTEAGDALTLIQNSVIEVEQKYAASGQQTGTGAQKAAEVLTLTEQTVTELLAKAGINADTAYIQNLINVIVGILNAQEAPADSTSVTAATS